MLVRSTACQRWTLRSLCVVGQLGELSFPFWRSICTLISPCFSHLAQLSGQQAEAEALQMAAEQNQKPRPKHE